MTMSLDITALRRRVERVLRAADLPESSAILRQFEGFEAVEDEYSRSVWVAFYGDYVDDDPAAVAAWRVREAAYYRRAVEALRREGLDAVVESTTEDILWIEVRG